MPDRSRDCQQNSHLGIVDLAFEIQKNILQNHHRDGLADLVLFAVSNKDCFDLKRAAYLVDNPDFNCLKGVCGYCADCHGKIDTREYSQTETLMDRLCEVEYSKKVKDFSSHSLKNQNMDLDKSDSYKEICEKLGMSKPQCLSWPVKHSNHGILLFESADDKCCDWKQNLFKKVASMLGMCGI